MKSETLTLLYVAAYIAALFIAYVLYPFTGHIELKWAFLVAALSIPAWLAAEAISVTWGVSKHSALFVVCHIFAAILVHPLVELRDKPFLDNGVQHAILARINSGHPAAVHQAGILVTSINDQLLDTYIRRNDWLAIFFPPSIILALSGILAPLALRHAKSRESGVAPPT